MHVTTDFVFIEGSIGERVRLARLAPRWTQAELAAFATIPFNLQFPDRKLTPADVGYVERGWRISTGKVDAILKLLGLEGDAR